MSKRSSPDQLSEVQDMCTLYVIVRFEVDIESTRYP